MRAGCRVSASVMLLLAAANTIQAGNLQVTTLSPARHSAVASLTPTIDVTFDLVVNPATINVSSVRVFGSHSGPIAGTRTLVNGGQTLRFTPAHALFSGDVVTVTLSHDLQAIDGSPLRSAGYVYQFRIGARPATRQFTLTQQFSVEIFPGEFPRIYGAQAADLTRDGWIDLAVVCENSNDIRVYPNLADGSGDVGARITPSSTTGGVPSPNHAADFNNDGFIDICTGNYTGNGVTILLGTGDGRFGARQDIPLGGSARGLAGKDFDGDGDPDLVCAVPGANRVSIMFNNGAGVLSAPTHFDAGGNAEYGLAAADLDNDGILDLAIGSENSQTITAMHGNGNGTFTISNIRNAGGPPWVVVCGDVNGDGNMDVNSANSGAANASILMGNGNGTLQTAVTYPVGAHTPATELGDVDGDGDLDMLISSFSAGTWTLYRNNGNGSFTFDQMWNAASSPAYGLIVDLNNDGAMDMVHLDEIAQIVRFYTNTRIFSPGDMNCDGIVSVTDIAGFVLALTDPAGYAVQYPACDVDNADINNDSQVTVADIGPFVALLTS